MKRIVKLLSMAVLTAFILQSAAVISFAAGKAPAAAQKPSVKIAVFSDPHYYSPDLGTSGKDYEAYLANDRKLISESDAILRKTVDAIKASDAQVVLVTGDLTKDGEYVDHQVFAGYLQELRSAGKKVYVIDGNHDINNPDAYKYEGDTKVSIRNVSSKDFQKIYADFGYKDAIAKDPNSLSYVVEPVKGLRIIAMDSCSYDQNAKLGTPVTADGLSESRLAWIKQQVSDAKSKGMTVIGMMHHGVVQHFSMQQQLFGEYVLKDWKNISEQLADLGMNAVFTGHFHAQDISMTTTKKGNSLFDIMTGSLVTYPCPYRLVELGSDSKLKITSHSIDSIDMDLGGKKFTDYAKGYLVSGLSGQVPKMLVGVMMQMGLTQEQAEAKYKAVTAMEVIPGKTVVDLVVGAMVSNYLGDETLNPQLETVLNAMQASSSDPSMKFMAQAMLSLSKDSAPADNNVTLDLKTGKSSK